MINGRSAAGANWISHNYLCKRDRHQGGRLRNVEPADTDWVICPLCFCAGGLWELGHGEPLCRRKPTETKRTYPETANKAGRGATPKQIFKNL